MKKNTCITALLLSGMVVTAHAQTLQVKHNRCFADINGDKKTDMVVLSGDAKKPEIRVYLSDGTNFEEKPAFVSNPVTGKNKIMPPVYFADLNGDGRADFVTLQGAMQTPNIVAYLASDEGYSEEHVIRSAAIDKGYDGLPRGFADIDGDGKADYLTFRGDFSRPFIVAYLSTGKGFNMNSYKSTAMLEQPGTTPGILRAFVDVNADGLAEYIDSKDGTNINIYPGTTAEYPYHFIYPKQTSNTGYIKQGMPDMPNGFIDADGDRLADYLTFRGNEKYPRIYINYSFGSRFETTPVKSSRVERGLDGVGRGFADVNGDGKWDYVTFRGTKENPRPVVYFSNGKDFIEPCKSSTAIRLSNDAAYNAYFTLSYTLNGTEQIFRSGLIATGKDASFSIPEDAEDIEVVGYCNECYDSRRIFTDVIERSDCPENICYRVYGDFFKKSWDFEDCGQ